MENTSYRVLFVDDKKDVTEAGKRVLEQSAALDVRTENSPFDALHVAKSFRPHLFLIDLYMPAMDGDKLATLLRSRFPDVPIVYITGVVADQRDGRAFNRPETREYLIVKPISAAAFRRRILGILKQCGEKSLSA